MLRGSCIIRRELQDVTITSLVLQHYEYWTYFYEPIDGTLAIIYLYSYRFISLLCTICIPGIAFIYHFPTVDLLACKKKKGGGAGSGGEAGLTTPFWYRAEDIPALESLKTCPMLISISVRILTFTISTLEANISRMWKFPLFCLI